MYLHLGGIFYFKVEHYVSPCSWVKKVRWHHALVHGKVKEIEKKNLERKIFFKLDLLNLNCRKTNLQRFKVLLQNSNNQITIVNNSKSQIQFCDKFKIRVLKIWKLLDWTRYNFKFQKEKLIIESYKNDIEEEHV